MFFLGLAIGAAIGYLATKPETVKAWIDSIRAKIGK